MNSVKKKMDKENKKRVAIALWRMNTPLKDIRTQTKIPERTLRRILAKVKGGEGEDEAVTRKVGSGFASRKVDDNIKKKLKKKLWESPTLTAKQLKTRIPELAEISTRTIQRICKNELQLPSRKMANKPLLTERMMAQRLEFAHEYAHWTTEDWKKVMFSDESHFELLFGNQATRVRRPVGSDRFDKKFTRKTVKHPKKVMVWACFSFRGRGGIEFLKEGEMMNGERYRDILENKLELFMGMHNCSHFLQDSAPCHKSKIVKKWFDDHPAITLIKWPGNSPDLNPIENMWIWMKNQLKESSRCTNLQELRQEILKLWAEKMNNIQYLRNLVESMPRRLQDVIERDGGCTKY